MINKLAAEIYANAKDKGFYEDGKANNIGERLCLIHSEVSEALEADRKNNHADKLAAGDVLLFSDDEVFKQQFKNHVKDTFEDEIADVVIRCLDTAAHLNFDIEKHIEAKMRYNSLREKMHGKAY